MFHNTSTVHTLVNFNVALCGGIADMLLPCRYVVAFDPDRPGSRLSVGLRRPSFIVASFHGYD